MMPIGDAVQLGTAASLRYERLLVRARWLTLVWVGSLALLGGLELNGAALGAAVTVAVACNALFAAQIRRSDFPTSLGWTSLLLDFAGVTLGVALTGGSQSLLVPLYWLTILTAALRFQRREVLAVALACTLSLVALDGVRHGWLLQFEAAELALRAAGFLATALAGSALVRRLRYEATRRVLAGASPQDTDAKVRRVAFLEAVATVRSELQDPAAAVPAVLAPIRKEADATAVALFVVDRERQRLRVHAAVGASAECLRGLLVPYDDSFAGECALWGRPAVASRQASGRKFDRAYEAQRGAVRSSVLCVPLVNGTEIAGVLELIDRRGAGAFTDEDLGFALLAAEHAADALRDSLALSEGRRHVTEMAAYHGAARMLADGVRREEIAARLLEEAMAAARADAGCVLLLDPDTGRLRPEVVRTPHAGLRVPAVPLGRGPAGMAAVERRSALLAPLGRDPLLLALSGGKPNAGAIVVPIMAGQLLAGLVAVVRTGAFDGHILAAVEGLVAQAAVTFENEHLRETVRSGYLKTVRALAETVDAKDPYTRQHSERVARYARALAEELHLPPGQVEAIEVGALLHDIGKIGIPEAVLRKPGRLTDEEFGQMKAHPVIGARIVEPLSPPPDMLALVRHHHERFDGHGYPDGLGSEETPLTARIVQVADCFDAMGSDRAYRRALTLADITAELQRGAGTQFDPQMVAAFLHVLDTRGRDLVPHLM